MTQRVDLRGLEPPEPLLRILAAIEDADGPREFLLSREPFPLYGVLAAAGWRHDLHQDEGVLVLRIARA